MEEARKWLQLVLIISVAVILILFWLDRKDQDKVSKEYWENPNFKTDSITVDVDYTKLPKPEYRNYVPPKVVVNYTPPNPAGVKISFDDSLITVIDSLKNHIYAINALYLKLYPTAPKLIFGEFTEDSLKLDLLYTNGQIHSSTFGLNFERFDYQWLNGGIKATERKKDSNTPRFTQSVYTYAGYDITSTSFLLGGDYFISKNKFRLGANTFVTIESKPEWRVQGTLGYRLYENR